MVIIMKTKHTFKSTLNVNVPVEELFNWHENPGAYLSSIYNLTQQIQMFKVSKGSISKL